MFLFLYMLKRRKCQSSVLFAIIDWGVNVVEAKHVAF